MTHAYSITELLEKALVTSTVLLIMAVFPNPHLMLLLQVAVKSRLLNVSLLQPAVLIVKLMT